MSLKFCKRLVKKSDPQSMLPRPGAFVSPENSWEMRNHGLILDLLSPKFPVIYVLTNFPVIPMHAQV